MNEAIKAVFDTQHSLGERVRQTLTARLPEDEINPLFDALCQALMDYGNTQGYNVCISTTHYKERIMPDVVATRLTTLRLQLYKLLVAHGLLEDSLLLSELKSMNPTPIQD